MLDVAKDVTTVTVGDVSFFARRSHHRTFWSRVNAGTWEQDTFTVLRRLAISGTHFIDVGAWIGPTALFAASLGAEVTAFECDPSALQQLSENIAVNPAIASRITVIPAGLAAHGGPFLLHASTWGNSESSVFPLIERRREKSRLNLTTVVHGLPIRQTLSPWLRDPHTLVKMDVEGAEYALLAALATELVHAQCAFYISFHPQNLVSDDSRPDRLIRLRATLEWIDLLWNHTWWSARSGELEPINKDVVLDHASAGKPVGPILFTRTIDPNFHLVRRSSSGSGDTDDTH